MSYDPVNNWQDRERYNETHDIDGNLRGPLHPSTRPGPTKPGTPSHRDHWELYALTAMHDHVVMHTLGLYEAMGRVVTAAVALSATADTLPPDITLPVSGTAITEAELHAEVELTGGDYQYANE